MVETPRAIENADAIAAVPGIDVLLMGTNDLCLEMGIAGKLDDESVVIAVQTVVTACKCHGKRGGARRRLRQGIVEALHRYGDAVYSRGE